MTMKDVIRNRLEVYRDKTAPLINYYQNKGTAHQRSSRGFRGGNHRANLKSSQLTRMVSLSFENWESHA